VFATFSPHIIIGWLGLLFLYKLFVFLATRTVKCSNLFNSSRKKHNLYYLKTQIVPRSKPSISVTKTCNLISCRAKVAAFVGHKENKNYSAWAESTISEVAVSIVPTRM